MKPSITTRIDTMKDRLVDVIRVHRKVNGLTQTELAKLIGIHQSETSDLLLRKSRPFSLDRLIVMVTRLGHDVEIHIS